ncbi:MAG TPA: ABC transporter substrate-binding protein [Acidimicrobiia bacterium]|nr:ABC transporter substrate-binding protein [Acidimicrobiia bacterium]
MGHSHRQAPRGHWTRFGAAIAVLGLVSVSFAGAGGASTDGRRAQQKGGGDLTFGLEAETTNYCLSRAQLAISGIQVVAAIYDTLTVPNSKGESVPYLAESVEPNADLTEWTIGLREGITFHNGEALDAAAVKLNLDAQRGAEGAPNSGPLLKVVLGFISDVTVVDPLTVKVTTSVPVANFGAYLYLTGRAGIMAPEQLNAGEDCSTKMIGTGPFMLEEYLQNEKTVVTKNPNYWQKGFPKADSITFVPVVDGAVRLNQLQGGQLDVMHTSSAQQIDALNNLGSSTANLLKQKPGVREIRYYVLLSKNAPFDDPIAREAFATAIDKNKINQIRNKGLFDVANGNMDVDAPGYLKNAGYPKFNKKKATALAEQYKESSGGDFSIVLGTTSDPENSAEAQLLKEELGKSGIDAEIAQFDQATLINEALAAKIDVLLWRNLHGGYTTSSDQDNYPWWSNASTGNFINFSQFDDADTQAALDAGRGETDPDAIEEIYTDFNKAMAAGNYIVPMWYVDWTIGSVPDAKVTLPKLPDGGGKPLFVYGRIPVLGLSKS